MPVGFITLEILQPWPKHLNSSRLIFKATTWLGTSDNFSHTWKQRGIRFVERGRRINVECAELQARCQGLSERLRQRVPGEALRAEGLQVLETLVEGAIWNLETTYLPVPVHQMYSTTLHHAAATFDPRGPYRSVDLLEYVF
ncbi:hypothetical protein P3T76_010108 [Phytophthora citrophthora]|uniref:Uncharacterized protein n=1 Tax=Phytophthora citrophthora TaxID=4793 RepID=A0AAD9GDZ7_9STRA|nr:hypothetical protein P3T76_010108 [Phytophthora citrophthora]